MPVQIPGEEVKIAHQLELEIIEAPQQKSQANQNFEHYLKKGESFKINAQGLISSKRGKEDGCVYFGSTNQFGVSPNDASSPSSGLFAGVFTKKEAINDVILGENLGRRD